MAARRDLRRSYTFDEVALVPGAVTINPEEVEIPMNLGGHELSLPVLTAAIGAVVDPGFAILPGQTSGPIAPNLDGLQIRYPDPSTVYAEVASAPQEEATAAPQRPYRMPDLPLWEPPEAMEPPVVVGNCVSNEVATEPMVAGAVALLVGVGPRAACTGRDVPGMGVPGVTATMYAAAIGDECPERNGRHVAVTTDGGTRAGAETCRASSSDADAVMLGPAFAQTKVAPAEGHEWGMAVADADVPWAIPIRTGKARSRQHLLFGPATPNDGTQNLIGALPTRMGVCGAANLREMHRAEMAFTHAFRT